MNARNMNATVSYTTAQAPQAAARTTGGTGTGPARTAGRRLPLDGAAPLVRAADAAASRRQELALFLRSRRERITPEQAGLPRGRRRRTPGLRREEVAQLAAVGVTWYTWLEQGRDIQVSAQVADSVARALMLDATERRHLFTLAGTTDPDPRLNCTGLSPSVLAMIAQLEPLPAAVLNSRYDIVAYNGTYGRLIVDLDRLPQEQRNLMWLAFTDPVWRERTLDWEENTRLMAAKFRQSMAQHLAEPAWKELLVRLQQASPEFRELWERHEVVRQPDQHVKRFLNPDVGVLAFEYAHLWLGPSQGPRLTTYTPSDAMTAERLGRLYALVRTAPPLAG